MLKGFSGDNSREMSVYVAQQQRRLEIAQVRRRFLDGIHHVRLRNEQVFPTVIVVIEEVRAPTGKGQGRAADAGGIGDIAESAVAIVVEKHVALVGKVSDNDVRPAVIIVVAEVDSHAGERLSIFVVPNPGEQAYFRKGAFSIFVIQKTLNRIVSNEYIGKSIAVIVGE